MIGRRVEWRVRGTRRLTRAERERLRVLSPPATTQAYSHPSDLLPKIPSPERLALSSTWHETDEVRRGVVQGWNATESILLVERDDGAWEEVPVVCARRCE